MNPFILNRAARMLFPWMLVLSLVVLYRGHHLPGGGFIGGLLGAGSFIFLGIGGRMATAKEALRVDPVILLGLGVGMALASGLMGMFLGHEFLTGTWLPAFGPIHLGTPFLFDVGVYLAVLGFILRATFSLAAIVDPEGDEE